MKRFSLYINFVLLALLAVIVYWENYIPRLWQKIFPDNSLAHYQQRPAYQQQLSRYAVYSKKAPIVMLGTSLTQDVDWNELLNRGDVINRGYGGDILAVLASRMPYVLAVQPQICFVEGGINDIDTGVPLDTSMQLLNGIADTLLQHNCTPVFTAVTYVTRQAPNQAARNKKIKQFNEALFELAERKGIFVVNNNPKMAPDGYLKTELAKSDGLHYLSSTYLIWKKNIETALTHKDL